MIQRESNVIEVEGGLTGVKHALSIDPGAMAHIMRILTDLYSDPEYAVIREYSMNANDAHVAAGNSDPIRVYLPTPLSPFFRVKDFGIGLSPEDIQSIYSRYGASTKRGTNDQVGMLGLGCKSALTYASQFTLTGVKDGVRCQVAISRDADGTGSMTVVDTATTDAPNGVEVSVPVRNANTFEQKAKRFFRFWEDGTVLLNDAEPPKLDALKLSDTIFIREVDRYAGDAQDMIVMGNVPYPVKDRIARDGLSHERAIVAYVDIGDVDFTPSREELHYTDVTNATLARVKDDFDQAAQGAIQRKVDEAKTRPEALAALHEWRNILPAAARNQTYTFKGEAIPTEYTPTNGARLIAVPVRSHVESRHSYMHHGVPAESWKSTFWVHGYPLDTKWTAPRGRKLRKYVDDQNIATERHTEFVLCDTAPDSPWIDKATYVAWDVINAVKLDRTPSPATGRIPGSYPAFVKDSKDDARRQRSMLAADIDQAHPVLYTDSGGWYSGNQYLALLNAKMRRYTLVQLSANRITKFKRDFPSAQPVGDFARDLFERWKQSLTASQRKALTVFDAGRYSYSGSDRGGDAWRTLRALDPSEVNDPEVVSACQLAKVNLTSVNQARTMFSDAGLFDNDQRHWKNPLDKYPLFATSNLTHSYIYLNAVYAASQKGA